MTLWTCKTINRLIDGSPLYKAHTAATYMYNVHSSAQEHLLRTNRPTRPVYPADWGRETKTSGRGSPSFSTARLMAGAADRTGRLCRLLAFPEQGLLQMRKTPSKACPFRGGALRIIVRIYNVTPSPDVTPVCFVWFSPEFETASLSTMRCVSSNPS